jgi:hypothetical protein
MEKSIKCTVFHNPRKVEDVFVSPLECSEFLMKNHVIFCEPSTAEPLDRYVFMFYLGQRVIPACLCLPPDGEFVALNKQIDSMIKHWSSVFNLLRDECYAVLLHFSVKRENYVWKPYQFTM